MLDDAFHRGLTDLSGHPTVWSVSERAKSHLNRVRRLSLGMPDYLGDMVLEHRAVLDAVAAHEPDAAEDALRHHLRMVLKELPTLRRQHPDYFESRWLDPACSELGTGRNAEGTRRRIPFGSSPA